MRRRWRLQFGTVVHYDDPEDDRDGVTPIIAALLRDMVAPARNAILTRLQAKYGPLFKG
jgi:hypothetical protein